VSRRSILSLLFLGAALPSFAAVSRLINFQGRVTDTGGTPVASSTALVFRLYNVSSGGSALYTESQTVTPDGDGLYSVNIGNVTPLSGVDFTQDLWLSVEVNTELLPGRYQLTTSPYAVYAASAAVAAAVADGSVTSAKILDGEVTNADVSGSAAIAYGKLNLAGGVVNADVSGSAAIAYSKLNLAGGIVNADVSASADIAASKINGGAFQSEAYSFPLTATLAGNRLGAVEGANESLNMLVQAASTTVTGSATLVFTTEGLKAYASPPLVLLTPVFNSSGDNMLQCNPHTVTATGMTIECVVAVETLGALGASADSTARQVNYILVGAAP
jgi:hypothetical protein